MIVGFQGEAGAFSEEAARALLGDVRTHGFADFDRLIEAVDAGSVDYGLLPCENSISGSIARAYDLLLRYDRLAIVDETQHPIVQCLIGTAGASVERIERVTSHPVALEQCRAFLASLPGVRVEAAEDTAGAVRAVVERGDPSVAAIGPSLAGQRYGGTLLASAIQDEEENVTRFFLIARERAARRDLGRLCLAFVLAHEPGSLHRALETIARHGLNLRSLVARPRPKRPFEYVFYAELDCPQSLDARSLARAISDESRILGRY